MLPISDLINETTREEWLAALIKVAQTLGLPTTYWASGQPIRVVLEIFADRLNHYWNNVIAQAIRAIFFDAATGVWLTYSAFYLLGIARRLATYAEGSVTVENRGGGHYTVAPGAWRIQNLDGKLFVNVEGGTLIPWSGTGAYPTLTLKFRAEEIGSTSTTLPGDLVSYPKPLVTGPSDVYVVAGEPLAPMVGVDEETDPELRARIRAEIALLSLLLGGEGPATGAPAPMGAYEAIALSPNTQLDDGTATGVTRVKVVEEGNAIVRVYLASASGAATGDDITPNTAVFAVNERIQRIVVPPGIRCYVEPATEKPVTVNVDVRFKRASLLTQAEALQLVNEALVDWFARELPIGGFSRIEGEQGRVLRS